MIGFTDLERRHGRREPQLRLVARVLVEREDSRGLALAIGEGAGVPFRQCEKALLDRPHFRDQLGARERRAADVGIAAQLLYAAFIGGKMKLNHYLVHAPEMDADFIAATRGKVYELEDEVSKLVGDSLERVWKALHPKGV